MRAALLSVVVAMLVAPVASAGVPKTCAAKKPAFTDGQVRIWTAVDRFDNQRWWICSRWIRKPKMWNDQGGGEFSVSDSDWTLRRFGSRIAYSWTWDNGDDAGWEIGWVGARSGAARSFATSFDARPNGKGVEGFALAPDGSMAFVERLEAAQQLGVATLGKFGLGHARNVEQVADNNVDPKTLAWDGTTIMWTTTGGQPGSVTVD